jgi:hypothetical protein
VAIHYGIPECLHKVIKIMKIFVSSKTLSAKVNVCTALHDLSSQVLT